MLTAMRKSRGLSLIEIMIALVIVALLLGVGIPAFNTFIANTKVRSAAEGLQSGLTMARAEALRRNQTVEFVLTSDRVDLGSVGTVTPATNGIHWLVRTADPVSGIYELIEARSGYEGSGQSGSGMTTVQVDATNAVVAFRGLGGTRDLAATARFDVSNPQAGACHTEAAPGPVRCLRVQVSVAGQIRMCDPSIDPKKYPGDTRLC